MRVVTYNLRQGDPANPNWSWVIEAFKPDIFLAQETREPPDPFRGKAAWCPVYDPHWGTAIYVGFGTITELPLSDFHGSLVGVEVDSFPYPVATGRRLRVFSVHAPTDKGWACTIAAVNRMLDTIERVGTERGDADLMIGGDFNLYSLGKRHHSEIKAGSRWTTTSVESDILIRLRKLGLINCWQTANPGVPLAQTLRWTTDNVPSFHCDGIFVPETWKTPVCTVVNNREWDSMSDHNPVIATFVE